MVKNKLFVFPDNYKFIKLLISILDKYPSGIDYINTKLSLGAKIKSIKSDIVYYSLTIALDEKKDDEVYIIRIYEFEELWNLSVIYKKYGSMDKCKYDIKENINNLSEEELKNLDNFFVKAIIRLMMNGVSMYEK